jgi:DNA-binding NtrC family response regulator
MGTSGKARILVVDDEPNIRTMLRVCLEGAGYDVTLAASGEAAVASARRSPPDLAFVDLRLGAMDGLALTRALAQEAPTAAVVLITAYATIDNAVDAMRAGAVDFLPKPFTPAQVLHTVDKVLGQARMRQELTELKRAGAAAGCTRASTRRAPRCSRRSPSCCAPRAPTRRCCCSARRAPARATSRGTSTRSRRGATGPSSRSTAR